ncbi:hypothetical protein PIB30_044579 [Stylosanthes scabra]|uniref:Uncharacterized protein n=1 Tax=Stylosanthes scabra TaxID=79078 RepID=A0ABU6YEJ6_9FABA|nr:hypothetical protein [Stylosanthes scabra]
MGYVITVSSSHFTIHVDMLWRLALQRAWSGVSMWIPCTGCSRCSMFIRWSFHQYLMRVIGQNWKVPSSGLTLLCGIPRGGVPCHPESGMRWIWLSVRRRDAACADRRGTRGVVVPMRLVVILDSVFVMFTVEQPHGLAQLILPHAIVGKGMAAGVAVGEVADSTAAAEMPADTGVTEWSGRAAIAGKSDRTVAV